jgi:hypothetical protein
MELRQPLMLPPRQTMNRQPIIRALVLSTSVDAVKAVGEFLSISLLQQSSFGKRQNQATLTVQTASAAAWNWAKVSIQTLNLP